MVRKISILGATGSIGTQTLDVIAKNPENFQLVAMSVGKNIDKTREILQIFTPKVLSVTNAQDAQMLQLELGDKVQVFHGEEGLVEVATHHEVDIVVTAVVGSVGLRPTLAAIEAGKTIALANKETLVTAGHLVMEAAHKRGVKILPVDSEHSALYQCLVGEDMNSIARLILTASGGSFRDVPREQLANVTVKEALQHPNWSMGAKITIDSATMMNKGLEVIEAHWLFGIDYSKIDVLLHKESIIHSMVEMIDSSVKAQLGTPDMRVPIQYALSYPTRLPFQKEKTLRLWELGALHFEQMDLCRFRCLDFAIEAGKIGGTMPTALNAANEVAVEAFLTEQIGFLQIEHIIEEVMSSHVVVKNPTLEAISEVDYQVREQAKILIRKGG